jgi:glutaredoxin 3
MPNIEIYTQNTCPYCVRAKRLLNELGLSYTEYEVSFDTDKRAEMISRSQRYTVPQIFIDGQSVGGSDELFALVKNGELSPMLPPTPDTQNPGMEINGHA